MAEIPENAPTRLPDHASVEAILAHLPNGADQAALGAALTEAFPGFVFSAVNDDDQYWRVERSVLAADGARIAEYRPWMEAELAKDNGDIGALWGRLQETDTTAYTPSTGSGATDYVQISLGREVEWRAGPIISPSYRPWSELELLDPSWIDQDARSDDKVIAGPRYRLSKRPGSSVAHIRTFLALCARLEREKREARRSEMERRVWVGSDGTQNPFLELQPGWFDFLPREVRFFQDWEESSARKARVFEHWALDITDYEHKGQREIGFIPRPLCLPAEKLEAGEASVHMLMDRIEAIDREVGLTFGWSFLATESIPMSARRLRRACARRACACPIMTRMFCCAGPISVTDFDRTLGAEERKRRHAGFGLNGNGHDEPVI